jgi:large subunit ribosomal protein L3
MAGLIGRKVGMMRVFDDEGTAVPVTVVEAGPCPVVQVRGGDAEGARSLQLGFGRKKEKRTSKAEMGHAVRSGLDYAPRVLREFRVTGDAEYELGQQLTVAQFEPGDRVKVAGTSKGRGFQGVVKRHGFAGRPGSHGHPMSRNPGSMGPGTNPSRTIKGKRLPGQMGAKRTTVLNLRVEKVDPERNLLFVRGAVPGPRNGYLFISK